MTKLLHNLLPQFLQSLKVFMTLSLDLLVGLAFDFN